ncbi:hypothetical protein L5F43_07905 [Aliarcobacter butzleri]|uniref:hypothetical protein n=1 Tax=Aliarcobacter butzleri TaxID=28197 RepID=UPI001EDBFDEC|nr:hypothetical protein [Aliarcobacter butzleri]MCG3706407.1 hypothetical protein [Aliarcobacter butzleri]
MNKFLKILIAFILVFSGIFIIETKPWNKPNLKEIKINQLNFCKDNIISKNKDLMIPPAVGIWGVLEDISAELENDYITITYTFKRQSYSDKDKIALDKIQKAYAQTAGCSKEDIRTKIKQ